MDFVFPKNWEVINPCPFVTKKEMDDESHLKKYIMWMNKSNSSWLDASMALIAHNKVMKKYSGVRPYSAISKIVSAYDDAISIINGSKRPLDQKINFARGRLNYIQESTLEHLQPVLKYKIGDPDSAFFCLYNLLMQDPVIKNFFNITWLATKHCTDCNRYSANVKINPIITLPKIDSFKPENITIAYHCVCKKSENKINLVYVSLPPCLIFHFENGAGKENPPLSFIAKGRGYHLTGIMTFENSQDPTVNHFITWVRDPFVNEWLKCNNLNLNINYFFPDFPNIHLQDVYMCMYEAFDDLGTIGDAKILADKKVGDNIPCYDVSEELYAENLQGTAAKSHNGTGETKTLEQDIISVAELVTLKSEISFK